MSDAVLTPYPSPPIVVVGEALPPHLEKPPRLVFEHISIDEITEYAAASDDPVPLVVLHLADDAAVKSVARRLQRRLCPLAMLCLVEAAAMDSSLIAIPGVDVQYRASATLTAAELEAIYTGTLYHALQMTQQQSYYIAELASIFAGSMLVSDSRVYQELQAVSHVLQAEGVGVFIDSGEGVRLFGVNIASTRNFRSVGYTIEQDSILATAFQSQQAKTYSFADAEIADDRSIRDCLEAKHAANLHIVPVTLEGAGKAAAMIACDLPVPVLERLESSFALLAQRVAVSVEQRAKQQRADREELLLQMTRTLIGAPTIDEIRAILCHTIEQIPTVRQAIVWQRTPTDDEQHRYFCRSRNQALTRTLDHLEGTTYFDRFIERFNTDVDPVYLRRDDDAPVAIHDLYDALRTELIVILPLYNTAFIHGLVIVAPLAENLLQPGDVHYIRLMTEAAGQTMERQWFSQWADRRTDHVEAIIRHTREGFFYVGETGRVDYVTPRFTDLTSIAFDQLSEQDHESVFRVLSGLSATPQQAADRLWNVYHAALDGDSGTVVELMTGNGRRLWFEVVPIMRLEDGSAVWLGIVREADQEAPTIASTPERTTDEIVQLLRRLPVYVSSHQARAVGLLRSLATNLSYNNDVRQMHILSSALEEIQVIGDLSDDVLQLANMQRAPTLPDDEPLKSFTALDQLVEKAAVSFEIPFDVDKDVNAAWAYVHEVHVLDIFTRLFKFLTAEHGDNMPIQVRFSKKQPFSSVHIAHHLPDAAYSQLEQAIYNSSGLATRSLEADLGSTVSMYLLTQLVRRTDGFITVDQNEIVISMPSSLPEDAEIETAPHEDVRPFSIDDLFWDATDPDVVPVIDSPVETIVICMGNSEILRTTIDVLREAGYELSVQRNRADSLWYLGQQNSYDLIIVDDDLPGEDALEFATSLRNRTRVPIVLMGDRENIPRARVLEHDIDTYLTQPIERNVILLEIKAMIRRNPNIQDEPVRVGDLEIDLLRYTVTLKDEPVELTHLEYKLLRVLAINAGQVLEHEQLLRQVWGPEYINDKQHLWVFISRLRKKLEPEENSRRYIHTRSGVGYVLKVEAAF